MIFYAVSKILLTEADVHALATDPEYQRRGAGAALLEKVKAIADEEGLAIYLTSTETGRKLYERAGFQVMKEIVIDLKEIGEVKKGREMFTVSFVLISRRIGLISLVYDTAKFKKRLSWRIVTSTQMTIAINGSHYRSRTCSDSKLGSSRDILTRIPWFQNVNMNLQTCDISTAQCAVSRGLLRGTLKESCARRDITARCIDD